MARDATRPDQRLKPVFWKYCQICTRRIPEDELVEQRGVLVCRRKGCLDEYDPREDEKE